MNIHMSRQVIPAIMISAFLVAVAVASASAFQLGWRSGTYSLASPPGSGGANDLGATGTPSINSQGVMKPGSSNAAIPQDECYKTCMIDKSKSGFMKSMCWLGCGNSAGIAPAGP